VQIDLVIFDMDGVIFEGHNFWLDLHREYGTEQEGVALADRYIDLDYTELAAQVMERLWKGQPSKPFHRLVQTRRYAKGVAKLFEFLHAREICSAIVSTGPYHLAERAQRDLSIDLIRANRLEIAGGMLTGAVDIQVRENHKDEVGRELISLVGTTLGRTAFVGDSDGDVSLAEIVGLPVAYGDRSKKLSSVAKHTLPTGRLSDLTRWL
jgi:phosphoserine phosphatase